MRQMAFRDKISRRGKAAAADKSESDFQYIIFLRLVLSFRLFCYQF